MIRVRKSFLLFLLMTRFVAVGQTPGEAPAAFEVASIKPVGQGEDYIEVTPGALLIHGGRLATWIKWAFGLQNGEISGATAAISNMLNSDRYEIVAKTPGPAAEARLKLMLQALLAERFQLAFHQQRREVQVFALVVDRSGPKLRVSAATESKLEASTKLNRRWTHATMAHLADQLSQAMQAPVLDQTGLDASYDFSLDLTPYLPADNQRRDIPSMMVTAVREQLGLRLVSRREPVDVLVIDRLEKPSAN